MSEHNQIGIVKVVIPFVGHRIVECHGIPETIFSQVHQAAILRKSSAMEHDLRYLCEQAGLKSIVVLTRTWLMKPFEIPPPIEVPFEPLELSEDNPPLLQLPSILGTDENGHALLVPKPRRAILQTILAIAASVPLLLMSIGIPLLNNDLLVGCGNGLLLVAIFLAVYLHHLFSVRWFLVPGGVLLRRRNVGWFGQTLRLMTPQDSIAMIGPGSQRKRVAVVLRRGTFTAKRQLTRLELAALLAAWRSPLPPPTLDRLSDWW